MPRCARGFLLIALLVPSLAACSSEDAEPAEAGCRVDFANTHYVNIPPWSERYMVDDANHRLSVGKVSYEFDALDRPIKKFNEPAVAEPSDVLTYDGAGNRPVSIRSSSSTPL